MFLCIRSDAGMKKLTVSSFDKASKEIRAFIDHHDLSAGCADDGWAFHLATIVSDDKRQMLATVSYNGRVWSCKDGSEIKSMLGAMKIYAIFATNHDLAIDNARCGQFVNWCPTGVYRTRETAEAAICEDINEARVEILCDLQVDLADGYKDVKPEDLDWSDSETLWTYYDEPQGLYYMMSEHELAD